MKKYEFGGMKKMKNFKVTENFFAKILPGFVVCFVISFLAQEINKFFSNVGAALFAIGIGIVCGNTFLNKSYFDKGTQFSEKNLLEYSIVLTGATLMFSDIAALGFSGVGFILCQMGLTIATAYFIGRKLGFNRKFSLLMGAGNAVCGSSAIATVSPVIEADSKDKGISITIVNVTGTILMVLLPIVTEIFYNHETLKTSAMIGGILQSIGQVIAGAQFVNTDVVEVSTIFKIIRIIFIVLVALVYSYVNSDDEKAPLFSRKHKHKTENDKKIKTGIPWFIIGFFLMAIIHTLGFIPVPLVKIAKTVSQQFEIIALAAIGMRVKFKDLISEGVKGMVYGVGVGTFQIIFALILIHIFIG